MTAHISERNTAAKKPAKNGRVATLTLDPDTPIRPVRVVMTDSGDPGFVNRILIGTCTRGTVRIEWHATYRGMMVPPNWSMVSMTQYVSEMYPIRYTVADGQNMIVKEVVDKDFEWLLLLEDDVCPPPHLLVRLDEYMHAGPPVVSGLYYTKGNPSYPLVYRGRGTSSFTDFKPGQKVWCDGVPTGCLLVHSAILKAMWEDAEEYSVPGGAQTRRVFETPMRAFVSPTGDVNTATGTSDLDWCSRVMAGNYFEKAGWPKYQRKRYPFLVDTSLTCTHIALDGSTYPPGGFPRPNGN